MRYFHTTSMEPDDAKEMVSVTPDEATTSGEGEAVTTDAKATGIKKRRRPWKGEFLKALARTGNVSTACRKAQVNRAWAYKVYYRNAAFRKRWDTAMEKAVDYLEGEAWKRAAKGLDKPIYQGGKLVGYERRYSDTLLIFLLKGRRPEVFGDKQKLEHSGGVASVQVNVDGGEAGVGLTRENLAEARALLAQMEASLPPKGEVIEGEVSQLPPG